MKKIDDWIFDDWGHKIPMPQYTHKGWLVRLQERPEGYLYGIYAPGEDTDHTACFHTSSLRDAAEYINGTDINDHFRQVRKWEIAWETQP